MIHRSPYPDPEIPDIDFPRFALARAEEFGDRPAYIDASSHRTLAWRTLGQAVQRAAAALAALGMQKGEVLAVCLPNVPEYAIALYGAMATGGAVTPVSPLFKPNEVARQVEDSRARYLVTTPEFFESARGKLPRLREAFVLGQAEGARPFGELLVESQQAELGAISPTDVALLPYSSGTTGLPKGVMLTHRNLVSVALQMATWPFDLEEGTVGVGTPPMYHGYGAALYFGALALRGATVICLPRFGFEPFLEAVQRYRAGYAAIVQPVARLLAEDARVAGYDLSSLKRMTCGATPLGEVLSRAVEKRLGVPVYETYGMTELGGPSHAQRRGDPRSSVGAALPGVEWKIADAEGGDFGAMQQGEICVRSPAMTPGYFDRPDETAAAYDEEGFLRTGDLGYADAEGRLYVLDRIKELIKVWANHVAPAELEAVLLSHPAVAEACVVPQPDREAGQVPKAFVVRRAPVGAEELQAYVAERVADYKQLRGVKFVESLPKSHTGKVLRRVLIQS